MEQEPKYKTSQEVLNDFSSTISAKPNLTKEEIFSKFPEFKNDDLFLQSAMDYHETSKSGKYKTVEELNSKFPEFEFESKKKVSITPAPSPSFSQNVSDFYPQESQSSGKINNAAKGALVPFSPIKVKQPSGEKDFISPKVTLPDLTKAPMKRYEKAYEGITGRIDNNTKEFDKVTAEAEKSGKEQEGAVQKYEAELKQANAVIRSELKAKYQKLVDSKSISAEEANLQFKAEYEKGFDIAQKEITSKYKPILDSYTSLLEKRKTLHNSIKSDIERAKLLSGSVGIIERNVNQQVIAEQNSFENAITAGLTSTGAMLTGALPYFLRFTNNNLSEFAAKNNMPELAKVAFEKQTDFDKSETLQKMEAEAKRLAERGSYYSNKIADSEGTVVDNFSNGDYLKAAKVAGLRFVESLPMMGVAIGMTALTGGTASSIIPGGFVFGSQNYYGEYADRPDMSEEDKLNASFIKGSLEMITELSVMPLLSPLKSLIRTGGREVAIEAVEKTLFGAMRQGYSKALPYFGWVQEGASEYANAVGAKIVDKILDPKFQDKDWNEVMKEANLEGLEAFGPGAFGGVVLTLPVAINNTINKYQNKKMARDFALELEKIEADIQNPNLTEAQKDILINRKQEIHGKLNEVFDADKEATAGATTEQISALDDINDQQDEVAVALQDETISDESKVAFEEKAKELAEQEKEVLEEIQEGIRQADLEYKEAQKGLPPPPENYDIVSEKPKPTESKTIEDFKTDYEAGKLDKQDATGGRNIGIYAYGDKIVKIVKAKRALLPQTIALMKERLSNMDNVFNPMEVTTLSDGSVAIMMDKANGKDAGTLSKTEIDNIPNEHWEGLEKTVRELSDKGVKVDLTKRSNLFYDKDKGFQFLDIDNIQEEPTGKFFKDKNGKEMYYPFERTKVFPKEFVSSKQMFENIKLNETEQKYYNEEIETPKEVAPIITPSSNNGSEVSALGSVEPTDTKDEVSNFPLLKDTNGVVRYIPEELAKKVYEIHAKEYPTGQSFQEFKRRGGFGINEMDLLYPNWRNELPKTQSNDTNTESAVPPSNSGTQVTEPINKESEVKDKVVVSGVGDVVSADTQKTLDNAEYQPRSDRNVILRLPIDKVLKIQETGENVARGQNGVDSRIERIKQFLKGNPKKLEASLLNINKDNSLGIDGRHRLEAAKEMGATHAMFEIKKSNEQALRDLLNEPVEQTLPTQEAKVESKPKEISEQISDLRAKEQADLVKAIPNIADFNTYGDKQGNMPDDLYAIYKPIYEEYNSKITPLLEKQKVEKENLRQIKLLETEKKIAQLEKEIRRAPIRGKKGQPSQRQLRNLLNNYKEQLRELKGLPPKKKVTDSPLRATKKNFSNTVNEENLSLDERLIFSAIGSLDANDKDIKSSDANTNLRKQGALVKQGGLSIDQIVTDFISENELDADMAQEFRNTLIDFVNQGDAYAWMNKIKEREAELDPDAIREDELYDYAYNAAVENDLTDEEINEIEEELLKYNDLTQEEYENIRNQFAESDNGTEEGVSGLENKTDTSKKEDEKRKSALEAKVGEAKNAYQVAQSKLAKTKQAAEKAGQEQQNNIFGGKPADALLFGTDLQALNKRVKEIQAEADLVKEKLDKAELDLKNFVPSNQIQLEVEAPIQEEVVDNSAELAALKEQLKKAKLTATKNEIQAKIDAEVKKVVVEKSINDVRDFLKDKFKINLPEGTQTKGFTLNQLIDLVADAAIELAKTGIDIELAIKQTIAALREAKYIGDIDEAKLEASVKEKLPKKEEKVKQEAEQGKRKLTKDFLAEYPQYEDVLSEGAINYNILPNQVSLDLANQIIDAEGIDRAIDKFSDFEFPMNDTVRVVLGQVLLKRLQDEGRYDSVIKVLEQLTRTATNIAQQLQAFSVRNAITAETEYRIAQRIVNKQRDLKAKTDKPKTDKIIKKAKEINKEIADQVVANLDDKINDNSKLKSKPNTNRADWGSKNKVFTKEAREKNKEALKKMFLSSVIPPQLIFEAGYHIEAGAVAFSDFYKSMTSEWGDKVIPYLKGAYKKASEDLISNGYDKESFSKDAEIENVVWENDKENKRLIKQVEIALKTKNRKAINKAIADLTNYAEKKGLWGQYRDYAIARLKAVTAQSLSEDIKESVPLEDFTNGLVRNIQDQINEQLTEEEKVKNQSKPKKPAIEIIADAFKNIEKYQEVFNKTKAEFTKKYSLEGLTDAQIEAKLDALEMTQEQAEEYLDKLDDYFGDLTPKPFSGKLIEQAVKEKLKDLNLSISDIVKQHYTVYDSAKKTLTEKLVEEAGLNETEAAQLAKAVQKEFDRIAIEKKKQLLNKILSKKERAKSNVISLEEDIIRLTNLGAFSDQEILNAYAKKMGYPELSEENIKDIKRLADKVQTAKEGFDKSRAIEDLLKYQANIKGTSKVDIAISIWYANMLSGYTTQTVNFLANIFNSMALYANSIIHQPKSAGFIAKGYYLGFKRGWLEAKETFKTGYSPIRGKIEVPGTLELVNFKELKVGNVDLNPANYLKYVGRIMKAADVIVFEALKDMRAYQLAAFEASKSDALEPSQKQLDKAAEIVGASDFQFQAATEEAQLIYEQELEDIDNDSSLNKEERDKALKQAKTDKKRRIYELMERNRNVDIVKESSEFAARGTYNYKPEGVLGLMSASMNYFKEQLTKVSEEADNKTIKYTAETLKVMTSIIIPFTNIIANVANEALNYTPLGILRAKAGKSAIGVNGKALNDQEKIDMYTKAAMGLTFMALTFLLTQKWSDDDEPLLEITANGHGDFRQNYSLQETGWQPYSFRIGKGPWVSYQYTPLFLVLGMIGQLRDYEAYRNEKLSDNGILTQFAVSLGNTMTSLLDMTFLSSGEKLLSSVMDPRSEDKFGQLKEMLKKSAQTAVVPALYTQTAKEIEKYSNIPLKEVKGTYMGNVLQHIPFARNMYFDKVNGLGEPIPPDTDKFISFSKDDKIWNLLKDKNISIIVPSQKQVKVVDDDNKQRFLTDEEYYNFVKKRGENLKERIKKNYEKISKMDKKNAQEYVSKLKSKATTKAKLLVNKDITEE